MSADLSGASLSRRAPIRRRRGKRALGRIATRIFAFNALLAFLPVAAFLLLDTYERGLVSSLEHALVQQARVTAAWLGQTAVKIDSPSGSARLDPAASRAVLAAIGDKRTARFRIVDTTGRLLADSSDRESAPPPVAAAESRQDAAAAASGDSSGSPLARKAESGEPFLYRVFSAPTRAWRRYFAAPVPALSSADYYASSGSILLGSEVQDALAGRYGAASRMSSGGQVSVTLYSAVPVLSRDGSVVGAVLLSQSTYRILRDLYAIRLDIAWIFVGSLVAAGALSLLLACTIVTPLRKLSAAAAAALAPGVAAAFPDTSRGDEIGDLQRSLRGLVIRLDQRMRQLERFAADAAHEFRNPLASIRSAAELAENAEDKETRSRFYRAIIDDAERLRATVDGLRRLSLAEAGAQLGERARIAVAPAAWAACEGLRLRLTVGGAPARVAFSVRGQDELEASVDPSALDVMLGNLLDNASSFARSEVVVTVSLDAPYVLIAVEDDGPGVPSEHLDRVFDRFFTWRPQERRGAHTGLGLSLVKALAEASGGFVRAENRPEAGARFVVGLPAAH